MQAITIPVGGRPVFGPRIAMILLGKAVTARIRLFGITTVNPTKLAVY
ncbi:MAG: hypothetical protein ACI97A_004402 [Planctomycetota bacterium]|jgi:hypothetical protein